MTAKSVKIAMLPGKSPVKLYYTDNMKFSAKKETGYKEEAQILKKLFKLDENMEADTDQQTPDATLEQQSSNSNDESYVELLSIKSKLGQKRAKREELDLDFEPTDEDF